MQKVKSDSKLIGKIIEVYGTREAFYKAMLPITRNTMIKKLKHNSGWKQREILKMCELLSIPIQEIGDYFFSE